MSLPTKPRWNRPASLLLLVLLTACGQGTLEVTNLNPVPVLVAVRYQWSADSVTTQGWYRVAPGESRKFTRKFRGVEPGFAVYAHTAGDPALIRWLHGQSDDGPGRRYFSGPIPGRIATHAFAFRTPAAASDPGAAGGRVAGFAEVPALKKRGRRHRVVLKDELFQDVYASAAQNARRDPLKGAAAQMAHLGTALRQQHWFTTTFQDPAHDYPFGLAALGDGNGPFVVGVDVKQAPPVTIWGDAYPLLPGDRLLSLNGRNVYGPEDLLSVLWNHATDTVKGGIRKPLAFTAMRGDRRVSGKTTYFFNEEHFSRSEREARRATVVAGVDATLFGFGCQLGATAGRILRGLAGTPPEVSRRRQVWNCQQEKARLRQLYAKNYRTGEMLSFLVPVGGSIRSARLARGAKGVRAARVTLAGTAAYTTGAFVSRKNRGSPLDGPGEIATDVVKDLALERGISVVFATDVPGLFSNLAPD